jgi:Cu2+-exporting ATPase
MDLLVALSTGTAYVFSAVAYACAIAGKPIQKDGETYFETAALLVTLVMLGRLIAAYARRRTTNAVNGLGAMQAEEAMLVLDSETRVIPVGLIHVGDMLRVGPGERVPTDGRVVNGEAHVDESAITGESAPVSKRAGSVLVAGTTLLDAQSSLDMRVTLAPDANTLSRMAELMRAAQGARLRVQDTADRVAGWLAPVVLVLGLITFLGWVGVGVSAAKGLSGDARTAAVRKGVVDAIGYAVAVLVVSCPCAIALCVPMVAVIAVAVGTRRGVLFKVKL